MPSPADELIAAGNAAYRARRFNEAIEWGRRAVAADSANPWAHNLLGAACAEEMEFTESRRAFAAAVAADPGIAISRLNLGYALILDGAFAEAEAELRAAIAIAPEMAPAYVNLTWIYKAAAGDPLIAQLEDLRRAARARADAQALACFGFALGKCYDDVGAHDLAFDCYQEGNRSAGVICDINGHERRFAQIRSAFSKDFIAARRDAGHKSRRPAFIVGMPRCGSSLIEDRLARQRGVAALGERPDIARAVGFVSDSHPRKTRYPLWAGELAQGAFARLGRAYAEKFESRHPAAALLIDKNLLNFQFLGVIALMLPQARILHCRRNPIDTCLSCYFQFLRPEHDYKFDLASLGRYYRLYTELMRHWEEAAPGIITVDYEAFVENPQEQYARLLSALGLDPAPADSAAAMRSIQTSSAFQARQPITRSSVGRWRNYERRLGPLIDALGDLAGV